MTELMFADLAIGMSAENVFYVGASSVYAFAEVSQDHNPIHLDEEFASKSLFGRCVAHGMLGASHISAVLGNQLPGPNSLYLEQTLKFLAPVYLGDTLTVSVVITNLKEKGKLVFLDTYVANQHGDIVISGTAVGKKVRLSK